MKKLLFSLLLTIICSAVYSQRDTTGTAFAKRMQAMYNELATPWFSTTTIEVPSTIILVNPVTNQAPITYPVLTPVTTTSSNRSAGIHQTIIFNSQGNTRLVTILRL